MVIFVVAAGLSLIFGCLRIINLAHGSFYMLAIYLTFGFIGFLGGSPNNFWWALLIIPLIVALVGGLIEFSALRRIYSMDTVYQLIFTYAFLLIIGDVVKAIWGVLYHHVFMPDILTGSVALLGLDFPIYYIFVAVASGLIGLGLWLLIQRTSLGMVIRAVISEPEMVRCLGTNVSLVLSSTFMFGIWLTALGGVLMSPIVAINLGLDMSILFTCFIVVIIGGMGSLLGSLVGSLTLGMVMSFGTLIMPSFTMALPFILMAIVIITRPQGLFGRQEA
jgi:branched-chain amino acid transport system permease protein